MKPILKYSSIHAVLTAAYVALVGTFIHFGAAIFGGGPDKPDTIFIPIVMLLLFVLSASICGSLVLGRPILWYLEGKKREAVILFAYTLGCLVVILIIALTIMFLFR